MNVYRVIYVKFNSDKLYAYLCDDTRVEIGTYVELEGQVYPFKVEGVSILNEDELPVPLDKMKSVTKRSKRLIEDGLEAVELLSNNSRDIKSIQLISSTFAIDKKTGHYADRLTITPNGMSMENLCNTDVNKIAWSYMSNNSNYISKYSKLCTMLSLSFECLEFIGENEKINFEVRFELEDCTLSFILPDMFLLNDYSKIAFMILSMVPNMEKFPMGIYPFNIKSSFQKEIEFRPDEICILKFADDSAIGDSGIMNVVTEDGSIYMYNDLAAKDNKEEQVLNMFDGLSLDKNSGETIIMNNVEWKYFYLGYSNHLFIRMDMYKIMGDLIYSTNPSIVYNKWVWLCGMK